MPAYYPVNIDVRNRNCVVIGGGHEGEFKVLRLVEFGAKVKVVSADVTDAVRELAALGQSLENASYVVQPTTNGHYAAKLSLRFTEPKSRSAKERD